MSHLMPSSRVLHLVDVVLAVWVAAWIGLGVAIGLNVRNLTVLSQTVAQDGRAVETIGNSLESLHGLPFVGSQIGKDAKQVQDAGASTVRSGLSSASSIRSLSVLLAIAVALLPSVPVFGVYLPARVKRAREAAALRRALLEHGATPEFEAVLARRALVTLGYRRLRSASRSPWSDVEAGRYSALAAAELDRLGVDRSLLNGSGVSPRR
jgi:hypothetical protein